MEVKERKVKEKAGKNVMKEEWKDMQEKDVMKKEWKKNLKKM